MDVVREKKLNHRVEVESGILAGESARLLKDFFKRRRGKRSPPEKYVFDLGVDN